MVVVPTKTAVGCDGQTTVSGARGGVMQGQAGANVQQRGKRTTRGNQWFSLAHQQRR